MHHSCQFCEQVGALLAKGLQSRSNIDRKWTWQADLRQLIEAAMNGCGFCHFIDYVLMQPWYAHPSRQALNTTGQAENDRPTEENVCIICAGPELDNIHDYACYKCVPGIARALADSARAPLPKDDPLVKPFLAITAEFSFELDKSYPGSLFIRLTNALTDSSTKEKTFTITAVDSHPLRLLKPVRDYSLTSARACEQIKAWLFDCDKHGCRPHPSVLPRRLLDLSTVPTGIIRIVLAGRSDEDLKQSPRENEQHHDYVALSYCWGGEQPFATRLNNLHQYQSGISISNLPMTIRDAINITYRLGVGYLWVDSLCIVQDDPDDRALQIAAMDQVYMNAYLTISASRASNCDQGFATPRDHSYSFDMSPNIGNEALQNIEDLDILAQKDRPLDLSCRLPCPDASIGPEIMLRRRIAYEFALEPVSRRAWTYQERLLSPRTVNFGKCLTWICPKLRELDPCTGDIWSPTRGDCINVSRSNTDWTEKNRRKEAGDLISLWQDIVMEYSNRQMSLNSDKLPAMAGLAKRFDQYRPHDQYLAGLWRSNMPHDLFWFMQSSGVRPSLWRAPSWSWASINGSVRFHSAEDTIKGDNALLSVLSYHCSTVDSRFGELLSAALVVRGRVGRTTRTLYTYHDSGGSNQYVTVVRETLCPADVLATDPHMTTFQESQRTFIDEEVDKLMTQEESDQIIADGYRSDEPMRTPKVLASKPAWLLPIRGMLDFNLDVSLKHMDAHTRIDGLLLEPVAKDTYRRIGIFEILKFDPAEHVQWSELHDIRLV